MIEGTKNTLISSFLAVVIIFSFLTSSCTTIRPVTKYDSSQFDALTDDIMELDWLKCGNLANKSVFIDFTVSQEGEYFLEDFDFSKGAVKKIKYEGNIGLDIKRKLEEVISHYCGAEIVQQKNQADISINVDIRKYYSEILETEKKGDDSLAGLNVEKGMDLSFKAATIFSTITTIDDTEDWKYNHLLSLKSNIHIKRRGSGMIFVNARNDITRSQNFIVDYDNEYTLAKGAIAFSYSEGSFLILPTRPKWDIKGKLDLYDIDAMKIKKQLTVDESDFDTRGLARVMKKEKKEYFDLYSSTPGNLKYLIYDYIKELVYRVNRMHAK